ncbi:MFS transporter [Streptomyces sp. NBC_00859]|uniref:MFS transporter n=1 Tax=Streptomyces sp. NBC_00859 TaxID=2903682 RepID=UPI00386B2B82|nr:MFS transporter [Streptomyces sp. NBC_00859]
MTNALTNTSAAKASDQATRSRWWALIVIALAQLMIVLDTTIVTVALPSTQQSLGMSDASRQWVVSAYTLAFGGLLLFGGRIADLVGRKRTLLTGILGFALASIVGGAAANGGMLIGSRAAQGVFAAILAPSTMSLLVTTFTDQRERAKAFGIFSAVLISGGAVGLVVGGLFTEYLNWRWCLYVNVPIALVAAGGTVALLPPQPGQNSGRLDVGGVITGGGGLAALVFGFGKAAQDGWGSASVVGPLASAAVLLSAFVILQRRVRNPLLPLRLLKNGNRVGALLAVALNFVGTFGMFLFITYQLQSVMHYSPAKAGVAFLPLMAMSAVTATQIVARLLPKVQARLLVGPGLLVSACGMFLLSFLTVDSSYSTYILPAEILVGLGSGAVMSPCMNAATRGIDPGDAGVVSASISTSQQIGAAIGTALLNTIATGVTATYIEHHNATSQVEANVQGYREACTWAAGILVTAAILALTLIRTKPSPAIADHPATRQ